MVEEARKGQHRVSRSHYDAWNKTVCLYVFIEAVSKSDRKVISENTYYHMFLRLWSEISLFHKLIYDIAQGSSLIGRDDAVRL